MIKFQENAWRSIQHPQFLSKSHPSLVPFKIPRSGQPKMLDSSLQTRVSEPVAKMSDTSSFTSLCVFFHFSMQIIPILWFILIKAQFIKVCLKL